MKRILVPLMFPCLLVLQVLAGATATAEKAASLSPQNDNAWVAIASIDLRARR
jgi:hypothetical protein